MGSALDPLANKIIRYWAEKDFRKLCNQSPDFVQSLLDFATLPNRGNLLTLQYQLYDFCQDHCTFKNGRIKPASMDELQRHVTYDYHMTYVDF